MGDRRQGSLFGEPEATEEKGRGLGTAVQAETLRPLAEQLPSNVFLGTSSWSFPGWEGIVYDRAASKSVLARKGLAAYARHPLLRSVGIDRTFYAPLPAETFAEYATQVPDDFRFLIKAPARCTAFALRDANGRFSLPNETFLDASFAAEEFVGPVIEGLGDKAGPLVFQFPPMGGRLAAVEFAERLGRFVSDLPRGPWYAVEVRDGGLLTTEYVDALRSAGATHCVSLHSRMPPGAEQLRMLGDEDEPVVVRWMLHAGQRYEQALERYEPFSRLVDEDPENRSMLAAMCVSRAPRGRPIVIVANNKAEGSAPLTVQKLARSIATESQSRGT